MAHSGDVKYPMNIITESGDKLFPQFINKHHCSIKVILFVPVTDLVAQLNKRYICSQDTGCNCH